MANLSSLLSEIEQRVSRRTEPVQLLEYGSSTGEVSATLAEILGKYNQYSRLFCLSDIIDPFWLDQIATVEPLLDVSYLAANYEHTGLQTSNFDYIVLNGTNIENQTPSMLLEVLRLLKEDGILFCLTPTQTWLYEAIPQYFESHTVLSIEEDNITYLVRKQDRNFEQLLLLTQPKMVQQKALKKNTVKITTITPAYNSGAFIHHLLESILQQPVELEIIIVDDASQDNTKEICQNYAKKYKNIKFISLSENSGAGYARNVGIRHATGDFILFIDSDDLVLYNKFTPDLLMELAQLLEQGTDVIYTAKCIASMNLVGRVSVTLPEKQNQITFHMPSIEFWTCIYRRNFLKDNHVYFADHKNRVDIETTFRYRVFSTAQRIFITPKYSFYLQRENQLSVIHTIYRTYRLQWSKVQTYDELISETLQKPHLKNDIAFLQFITITSLATCADIVMQQGWNRAEHKQDLPLLFEIFQRHKHPDSYSVALLSQEQRELYKKYVGFLEEALPKLATCPICCPSNEPKKQPPVYDAWEILNPKLKRITEQVDFSKYAEQYEKL